MEIKFVSPESSLFKARLEVDRIPNLPQYKWFNIVCNVQIILTGLSNGDWDCRWTLSVDTRLFTSDGRLLTTADLSEVVIEDLVEHASQQVTTAMLLDAVAQWMNDEVKRGEDIIENAKEVYRKKLRTLSENNNV